MNYSIVFYIIGWILNFEAAFMALPTAVALIYRESEVWCFLATMAVCLMVGMILVRRKPKNQIFYVAESFVAVSLSWVLLSVMGAVPFVLSGYIPNPIDALFETVSGFTTTGASILSSVEQLPKCLLFWRSFTHWIGGMGVLVFLLSVLPMVGGSHMNLMKAESPGPIVSRLVPKVQMTAKLLYQIYLGMTILEAVILILGKMPIFDAITITVGTAGTGGFAIRNDSLASYTAFQKNVFLRVSVLLISGCEHDLVTNFTAVTATFNNIGPGLVLVGPTETGFSVISNCFTLYAGRTSDIYYLLAWKLNGSRGGEHDFENCSF